MTSFSCWKPLATTDLHAMTCAFYELNDSIKNCVKFILFERYCLVSFFSNLRIDQDLSKEICFIFFWLQIKFVQILEVYKNLNLKLMGRIHAEPSCTGMLRPACTVVRGPWPYRTRLAHGHVAGTRVASARAWELTRHTTRSGGDDAMTNVLAWRRQWGVGRKTAARLWHVDGKTTAQRREQHSGLTGNPG
jgi:hypothetical protein